jgi:hypothetical protein
MDSGVTADPYQSTALQTAAQFKMYVVVGSVTNLPIQMVGSFASLGQPAQQTRIDLTIGVDSNGDGIPDSWELAYLAALGSNLPLSSLNANLILSPDGLTLLQEYLAGYYPYDPSATFTLRLVSVNGGSPILEFTAITGRSYSIFGSSDLHTWTPLSFSIPAEGNGGPTHSYYFASDVRTLQVQALQPGSTSRPTLNFTHSGNQVIFSWPTNAAGFSLVSSPSLPASTWTPIAATPQVVGSQFVLSNTMAGAKQFFRLAHPQVNFFRLGLQ